MDGKEQPLQEVIADAIAHVHITKTGWEDRLSKILEHILPVNNYGRRYVILRLFEGLDNELKISHNQSDEEKIATMVNKQILSNLLNQVIPKDPIPKVEVSPSFILIFKKSFIFARYVTFILSLYPLAKSILGYFY